MKRLERGRFSSCLHFANLPETGVASPVNCATFPQLDLYRCLSEIDQSPFTWTSNGAEALWLTTCQVTVASQVCSACLDAHCVGVAPVHSSQGRDFAPYMTTRAVGVRIRGAVLEVCVKQRSSRCLLSWLELAKAKGKAQASQEAVRPFRKCVVLCGAKL